VSMEYSLKRRAPIVVDALYAHFAEKMMTRGGVVHVKNLVVVVARAMEHVRAVNTK